MSVIIYTTPTCPYCKMAKDFFEEHHIESTDIDVSANMEQAKEMVEKSGQMGVPVIIVPPTLSVTKKEEVIIGFDRDRLEAVLNLL